MNCPKCNALNPDDALFCSSCGGTMETPVTEENVLFKEKPSKNAYPTPPTYGAPQQNPYAQQNPYSQPQQDPYAQQPQQNPYAQQPQPNPGMPPYQPNPNQPYDPTAYGSYNNYTQGPGTPQKPGDRSKDWAAITGLILGILSIPCCFCTIYTIMFNIPFFVNVIVLLPGIIFSIIGLKSTKKGLAIAGLVCGCIGLLINTYFAIFMIAEMSNPNSEISQLVQEFYGIIESAN